MERKYTNNQITKALTLVNSGLTRKQAAKAAGLNIYSLNYYLSKKASPKLRKYILRKKPTTNTESYIQTVNKVIRALQTLV